MKNLLIIEDNYQLALSIKDFLGTKNYNIFIEIDGLLGFQKAIKTKYDLIILDINLPRKNGFDILYCLRQNHINTPIIMLTRRLDNNDIVHGFDSGADGYIGKPFDLLELKARIDAMLTRPPQYTDEILHLNDLTLNITNRQLSRKNKTYALKQTEFKIIKLFLKNPNQVISRERIFNNVWSPDEKRTPGLIDVYIKRLRDKVDRSFDIKLIKTIHGLGYMLKG